MGEGLNEPESAPAAHSPLPWRVDRLGVCAGNDANCGSGFYRVALCRSTAAYSNRPLEDRHRADAEFIVRAVNNHDSLLEIVKEFVARHDDGARHTGSDCCDCGECRYARKVIAEAEGRER